MILLNRIRELLDALVHPSARGDAMAAARHRAFIASRLLGSLVALALVPIYLALRGAPSAIEIAIFAWLVVPILMAYFLSRTGRYESAHVLSSLALAAMVMAVALQTGGVASFAAVWLVVVPIEAAVSASRRVVGFAVGLALGCVATLVVLQVADMLPVPPGEPRVYPALQAGGIASATLFAAILAFAAEALSRASGRLLSREERRYRMLALNMSDIVSRHRRNGAIEFVSPAAEALLGVPASRLCGHGLFDRVHVADRPAYLKALSDAARGSESRSVEFRIRRDARDGGPEFIWLEMRCRPLDEAVAASNAGGRDVVAVMRDVTERKTQEDALQTARIESERAQAAKNRFLATMSHELRTPLNAIIGFSEMIMREGELPITAERRGEYAQLINASGQHLLSVVNGILDMSKMESGSFEVVVHPFPPREAIIASCSLMALKAQDSGVDLRLRLPESLPEITADARAFKQILLNLISNAIKFTDREGIVTVSCCIDADRLLLSVSDTGIGIGPEDLKRIGDPFFQAGTTYQRRHEGTGLGLSIVKNLVGLHGGELDISSKLGEGTTIVVALPLVASARMPQSPSNVMPLTSMSRPNASSLQVKKSA